ncbi:hypothetical protein [Carboxylicivirga sp. M1479]|uniref:hypothetical protein n=1 Tax=Carboxylicivirga sp. M1479 TaxID=2594476 RepID=UPI0011782D38|nr:hypothetical protein [Carboxylicivirga sp. M1479]TRX71528.1 hypothetical protein FNN09_06035 [Carboxylicivirga sp. M1479]
MYENLRTLKKEEFNRLSKSDLFDLIHGKKITKSKPLSKNPQRMRKEELITHYQQHVKVIANLQKENKLLNNRILTIKNTLK